METVLIVIHLIIVLALIAVVLLQRSEGGALGIGGGGGGNFMSGRGQANVLTRATAILAGVFFLTSIGLTILARTSDRPSSILDNLPENPAIEQEGQTGGEGTLLEQLGGQTPEQSVPETPAEPQIPTTQ
jgi:preprotein translocase subunit SecG